MKDTNWRTLERDPSARAESLHELVGLAHAIEEEAVTRYRWLAGEMRRRGDVETAEAFEVMAAEEQAHITAVDGWAASLGEQVPPAADFRWRLPHELAESWDAAVGSALLTPYRAFAIAIDNEERAFAFYAYLAAASADEAIAREAERLALEELRHAARLRIWRRAAWRQEGGASRNRGAGSHTLDTPEALDRLLAEREAEIASCHRGLAERLRGLGDAASAALLDELADQAAARASAAGQPPACAAEECRGDRPAALLLAAQRPLESLCDLLEEIHLGGATEQLQAMAETILTDAIARIARIGRRLEAVEAATAPQ